MKILMLNVVCGIRSTGRICTDLAKSLEDEGHIVRIAYGRETVPKQYQEHAVRIGNNANVYINAFKARLFDNEGLNAKVSTRKFLKWAEEYNPDLLWLHNIHGYYINYQMLFQWIKSRPQMRVKWTLHDCWAFTGHCTYFSMAKCEKWKTSCSQCVQKKSYPESLLFDRCFDNFEKKRRSFCGVNNMTLITPSKWLACLVKESFLNEYPVEVCYNTVDTSIFKPTPSDFKQRMGINKKKIVLGVASTWSARKGLQDFIKLAGLLNEAYVVVLVGLTGKENISIPKNIIGITRTNDVKELAAIYTVAEVFVNLTYEDNYPTVNLEALACGTPVITYETGGSGECLNGKNGKVFKQGDVVSVANYLNNYYDKSMFVC